MTYIYNSIFDKIFIVMIQSIREYWLLLISTPIYITVIGVELILSNIKKQNIYNLKDTAHNVYLMLMNMIIDVLFRGIYIAILHICYQHRLLTVNNVFVYWIGLIIIEDFLYYWLHRFDHEVRLFWAVHITHHSSIKLNFTVGFRSSVFEPLYRFIYFLPLAFLGAKALDIAFIYSATQIWGLFTHTETIKKMGWLEYIFITPSHHRVHHASNPKYLDKNMGMFLIIWDKLFGTFQAELPVEEYQPIQYGLTKPMPKKTAISLIFYEWNNILKDVRQRIPLKLKLKYIFGPPGWSHDGSRQTSKQLRASEIKKALPVKEMCVD